MAMGFDLDASREVLDTLTRNKSRSFLTGFGVFWGVFMLVALLGGGKGLQEMLRGNFDGFATNAGILFAQNTTKPYSGFRKGRAWSMEYKDVARLKRQVPGLETVTPQVSRWNATAIHSDKKANCSMRGLLPDYVNIEAPKLLYGRFVNAMDAKQARKVCVINRKVYQDLFPGGGDPCGERICVDNTYYEVVGVDVKTSNIRPGGEEDAMIALPLTTMQREYNMGDSVHLISVTARPGVTMESVTPGMRAVLAGAHRIAPNDEKAISVFNTEVLFGMMDNMFSGVNLLVLLVGLGTLLAGAIGVSNIMMVTVRERTVEIGIRRAIGATPRDILGQVMAESLTLTLVAGMGGILFAVLSLEMMELANTRDGVLASHFQVGFWTAVASVAMLCVLGVLAGLVPALRAMGIKPVDAIRDE